MPPRDAIARHSLSQMCSKLFRRRAARLHNGAQYQSSTTLFNRANDARRYLYHAAYQSPQTRARVSATFSDDPSGIPPRVGIMGDIKTNARRLTPDLKTSRQGSLRPIPSPNRLFVNVQPAGAQQWRHGSGIRLGNLRQRQSGKRRHQ